MNAQQKIHQEVSMWLIGASPDVVIAGLNDITSELLAGASVKKKAARGNGKTSGVLAPDFGEAVDHHLRLAKSAMKDHKFSLPILGNVAVRDGRMLTTDCESWLRSATERPDGMYSRIGKELHPSNKDAKAFRHFDLSDFPVTPEFPESYDFKMPFPHDELRSCLAAVPERDPRKVLLGVNWDNKGGELNMIATSGKTLCHRILDGFEGEFSFIMPGSIVGLLLSFKKAQELELTSAARLPGGNRKCWGMRIDGQAEILFEAVDGTYPNWPQIVPEGAEVFFTVPTRLLRDALRELEPFGDERNRATTLRYSPQGATFTVVNEVSGGIEKRELPVIYRQYSGMQSDTRVLMPIKPAAVNSETVANGPVDGAGSIVFDIRLFQAVLADLGKNGSVGIGINGAGKPVLIVPERS